MDEKSGVRLDGQMAETLSSTDPRLVTADRRRAEAIPEGVQPQNHLCLWRRPIAEQIAAIKRSMAFYHS